MSNLAIYVDSITESDSFDGSRRCRMIAYVVEIVDNVPRNLSEHDHNAESAMADLHFDASMSGKNLDWSWYGYRAEYRSPYTVDLDRARGMVKTLDKVERGMLKLASEFGPYDTYSQFLIRVARVLGISKFIRPTSPRSTLGLYSEREYRVMDAAGLAYHVASVAQLFREECRAASAIA